MVFLYKVRLADKIKQFTIGNAEKKYNIIKEFIHNAAKEVLRELEAKQPYWSLHVEELSKAKRMVYDK